MASISLRHIYKVYERSKTEKKKEKAQHISPFAVNDFNLEIKDGEFVVIVGPSGCGKSTTLRMIAGLEDISSGELYIGDTLANNVDVSKRNIAMVFQNYALYPHMTSAQNMSYALKLRKIDRPLLENKDGYEALRKAATIYTIITMVLLGVTILPLIFGGITLKYLNDIKRGRGKRKISNIVFAFLFLTYPIGILLLIDYLKVKRDEQGNEINSYRLVEAKSPQYINDDGHRSLRRVAKIFTIISFIESVLIFPLVINILVLNYLKGIENGTRKRSLALSIVSLLLSNPVTGILLLIDCLKVKKDEEGNEINNLVAIKYDEKSALKEFERMLNLATSDEEKETINKQIELLKNHPEQVKSKKVHYTKAEINERVNKAAEMLDIKHLLGRKPSEMSGGQRQRIALGRALVRDPKVFLLDEPLSNLDAKLRASMRNEIVKLHDTVKTTFVYVTHDQVEAMTMGDRIVVMKDGFIQQVGTPREIYDTPHNQFVAGFIGTPQMNFFDVKCHIDDKKVEITLPNDEKVSYKRSEFPLIKEEYINKENELVLGVRGEHIHVSDKGVSAHINFIELLGNNTNIMCNLENDKQEFAIALAERSELRKNESIHISFDARNIHLFEKEKGNTIYDFQKEDK